MTNDTIYMRLNFLAPIFAKMPKTIMALRYRHLTKWKLNLKDPQLFNEKIIWLSFNTDTTEWTTASDKYAVRDYVINKWGSDDILNEIYGVYERAEDIDFDALPQSFVLKTNNACTTNIIVHDKTKLDVHGAIRQLNRWLKHRYGDMTSQPHYSRIKPLIIAEKLLVQDKNDPTKGLIDYKFNCFEGKVHSCVTMGDRTTNSHRTSKMHYDLQWNPHPEMYDEEPYNERFSYPGYVDKPQSLDKMIEIASVLCKGFKYVRVDLYEIEGKPVFGELSFLPGFDYYRSLKIQRMLGDLIKL